MKKLNKFVSIALCSSLLGGMAFAQEAELGRNPNVRLLESAQQSVTKVQFRMDNLKFTEVQTPKGMAQVPTYTEGVNLSEKGMPTLPILSRSLAVSDTREMKVEVISSKFIEKKNVLIAPSKGMIMRNENPNKIPYVYGKSYSQDKFFPGEIATLDDPFIVRDVRGQVVTFAPLQYNPVTKTLRIYTEITVAVSETAQLGKNALKAKGTFAGFEDTYKRLFMNYEPGRYTPLEEKQDGRMIVIVPQEFKDDINDFVAWKNQRGLRTEVKVAEEIASPVTANAVRAFVKAEYEKPGNDLMYVLLIGDNKHIPAAQGAGGKSDQVFGQIVGNDHYNEIFIGRFSCESKADLKTQIDRTIHYERDVKANEAWLGRALCIASSDGGSFADNGETDIQHETVIANLLESYGYTYISKRFGDYNVNANHIISDFNSGICTTNYTGHGSDTAWGTSGFNTTHMKQLANYNQLPYVFDVACVNGNFLASAPCFAEGLMRAQKDNKPTGAIAIIASTINQPWNPPMRGQDEMNEILCEKHTNNIKRTFGGITTNGIFGMLEKYKASAFATADTWTVFGDPSLLVRTLTPKTMTVTAPAQINLTDASVNVSCDFNGAIATISANGKMFGSAVVENGTATINLAGLTNESTVTLTVVGYNKETVVKAISTNGEPSPYQPVSNLSATVEGQKVTLKWDAPAAGNRAEVVNEGFESGIPSAWKTIDADGDGNNWDSAPIGESFPGHNSVGCVSSASYINNVGPQTPDNYLITPELSLPSGGTLTFWVCAQDAAWAGEHYAVYASSTGNDAVNFTNALLEETLTAKSVVTAPEAIRGTRAQGTWYQKTVQLPAGTKYVAFRHFNCTDFFWLNLDDVVISGSGTTPTPPADYTYTIYRDGTKIKEGLTATTFEEEGVAPGNHEYCVEVKYQAGVSPKVCKDVTINGGNEFAPVQNLTGSATGQKVTLKWDAPNGTPNPNPNPDPNPEPGLTESFDAGIPATWTLIDADGDGHGWKHGKAPGVAGYNSNGCVYSESFGLGGIGVLTPDNYLITPALNLPNGGKLTFWVCAQDADYASEHYAVYASSTGNAASNFTNALLEETLTAKGVRSPEAIRGRVQGTWYQKTVDLPAGTKYVAFRHFQSTDMFYIDIDEVEIKANAKRAEVVNEGFESGIPSAWKTIDADGDGNNWDSAPIGESFPGHNSVGCVSSASYINNVGPQTPDNYLITPELSLPSGGTLTFWVCAQDAAWAGEHYAVYASSTGNDAANFTNALLEETLTAKSVVTSPEAIRGTRAQGTWYQKTVQLPAGTKYVAFRHFNCTDFFWLNLDDVVISGSGTTPTPPADYTYTIYRDGTKIKEGLTATTFEEEGVAPGNHEYCVEVKYAAGVSPKKCVNVTVDPQQFNPVQNLTAEQAPNSMDAILKWNAPASKRAEVVNEGFESGIPSAWKTIDADGDGNNWDSAPIGESFPGHNSVGCVSSASYINNVGPQTPDNYLITPELSLANGGTLTFWVCAQDAAWAGEHYAVYASSTGNDAVNFTNALLEETLTAKSVVTSPEAIRGTRAQGTWYQKTVQLPAGTKYVAFRHFNCTDFFWLNLDDVVITSGNAPLYTYTIYRNNTQIASGVTETTYRDPDLAAGSYTYGVKVVYPNGESAMETTTLNITSLADVTVQKPYALTVVGKTITVSCQGEAMIYDMNGRRLAAGRNTVVYTAQGGSYAVMVVVDGKSYVEKLAIK